MKSLFFSLMKFLNGIRLVTLNLIFFSILAIFFIAIGSQEDDKEPHKQFDENGIVLLNLKGNIVEQKTVDSSLASLAQQNDNPEVLLSDLLKTIESATTDSRVKGMIILPSQLQGVSYAAANEIGKALAAFKAAGKPMIASAPSYSQSGYYLASFADEIYLSSMGEVGVKGIGGNNLYFGDFLKRLGINVNVFKVGTYKSAVEPFIKSGMSDPARENAQQWMGQLWHVYTDTIEHNRNLSGGAINAWLDHYPEALSATGGDAAKMAVDQGLVDGVLTRAERMKRLKEFAHTDSDNPGTSWTNYLGLIKQDEALKPSTNNTIAVINASGQIMNGEQPPGTIGGQSTAALIRKAIKSKPKAIVMRVNSPGGSAYASEVIREEVLAAKDAGIPFVVSMGGVAASGGYWISTSADYIFANPQTITGSIGVFGLVPTFEEAADKLDLHTDGVSTTPMAGGIDPISGISDPVKKSIQLSIEHTYGKFLSIVAQGRDMTTKQVDKIAQGRVWNGTDAVKLGLVDKLGSFEDALNKAAELANIKDYQVKVMKPKLSELELIIQELKKNTSVNLQSFLPKSLITESIGQAQSQLGQLNDPRDIYTVCLNCNIK